MKIVIAPDKFKGCLGAAEVAAAIAVGLRSVDPALTLDLCPMADGGEGTVDALVAATGGKKVTRRIMGPLPDMKVDATFGLLGEGRTAVIEMASASGLHLLTPEQRNPLNTTTYGTGQLLMAAVELGARRIILGIGGSATTDAGLGCAQACGLISAKEEMPLLMPLSAPELCKSVLLQAPITGRNLGQPFLINPIASTPLAEVEIIVACDVSNPLYGPEGAARVYGPQKGATPEQVQQLDASLERLARRLDKTQIAQMPGAGAAGGLGFGMLAFFGARIQPGVDIVIDAVNLRQRLANADLCLTGEGKLDAQSLAGKTPIGVARICKDAGIPCIGLAGSVEAEAARNSVASGMTACFSICNGPMDLNQAMRCAKPLLSAAAANILRAMRSLGRQGLSA
ncbi:MAG: glycerate kinase [Bacillota bacterium]